MKKLIIAILFTIPLGLFAQRDFDYKFFTKQYGYMTATDTVDHIFCHRYIEKDFNTISIRSVPFEAQEPIVYEVTYLGFDAQDNHLVYIARDQLSTFRINPFMGTLVILTEHKREAYYQ